MTDVTDFVFERLELIAERVAILEAEGNTGDAEFLRSPSQSRSITTTPTRGEVNNCETYRTRQQLSTPLF